METRGSLWPGRRVPPLPLPAGGWRPGRLPACFLPGPGHAAAGQGAGGGAHSLAPALPPPCHHARHLGSQCRDQRRAPPISAPPGPQACCGQSHGARGPAFPRPAGSRDPLGRDQSPGAKRWPCVGLAAAPPSLRGLGMGGDGCATPVSPPPKGPQLISAAGGNGRLQGVWPAVPWRTHGQRLGPQSREAWVPRVRCTGGWHSWASCRVVSTAGSAHCPFEQGQHGVALEPHSPGSHSANPPGSLTLGLSFSEKMGI